MLSSTIFPKGARSRGTMNPDFPDEFCLLLLLIRIARDTQTTEDCQSAVAHIPYATNIGKGISRHGLSRIVPSVLKLAGLPSPIRTDLEKFMASQTLATLTRVGETARISRHLQAAGIRFLVIKGVALSAQIHENPVTRDGRDIDIVIDNSQAAETHALLNRLDYFRADGQALAPGESNDDYKETGYLHRTSGICVEVHNRLTDNPELIAWSFEEVWTRRETVTIGSQEIPTLARSYLPIYLCVHGAKHCWSHLLWLDDLAGVLRTEEEIYGALRNARELGLHGVMLHALSILQDWLRHPVPAALIAEAQASARVRLLNRVVSRHHNDRLWHTPPSRNSWRRFRQGALYGRIFAYAMKLDWRYLRRQVRIELNSHADTLLLRLPPALRWLYPAVRPFGWLVRRWRADAD